MPVIAWIVVAVLVVAAVGGVWAVRRERRDPSSFTRGGDLAWWGLLPTWRQEDIDNHALGPGARLRQTPEEAEHEAYLERAAQARLDAEDNAREAAGLLAVEEAARINALHHP